MTPTFSECFLNDLKNKRYITFTISSLEMVPIFENLLYQPKKILDNDLYYGKESSIISFLINSIRYNTPFLHKNDVIEILKEKEKIYEGLAKNFKIESYFLLEEKETYNITIKEQVNFKKNFIFVNKKVLNFIPYLIYGNFENNLSSFHKGDKFYYWTESFSIEKLIKDLNSVCVDKNVPNIYKKVADLFKEYDKTLLLDTLIINSRD